MKKLLLLIISVYNVHAQQSIQQNKFKIGMMGVGVSHCINSYDPILGCVVPVNTVKDGSNFNTSVMNILSEDGFNIVQTYNPSEWDSKESVKRFIELAGANGLEVELSMKEFFKPDPNYTLTANGSNVYSNCGIAVPSCLSPALHAPPTFRANYDDYFNTVISQQPYKNIVWGIHVTEEPEYYHQQHRQANCQGNAGWDLSGVTTVTNGLISGDFMLTEIPPVYVAQAFSDFKNKLLSHSINDKKMVLMQANHGRSINNTTADVQGTFNIPTYLGNLNMYDNRDVFFEGSYYKFPNKPDGSNWIYNEYGMPASPSNTATGIFASDVHYLGKFKSIDYVKKNHCSQVHSVMSTAVWESTNFSSYYNDNAGEIYHVHSDYFKQNANWLWFSTYTSIIHGASGVWFWTFNNMYSPENNDPSNKSILIGSTNQDRYNKSYFPYVYKNFVAHLASELGYLVKNNIISTDPSTTIYTKTDHQDKNCIVPAPSLYMPSSLPTEKINENYGLRYTIKTNGSEVWMIISNPLNVAIENVPLNFLSISNPIIQNSTGVDVFFDDNSLPVNNNLYKTSRNSNINLINNTVGLKYSLAFVGNKQLSLSFGPLDVKVIKFNGTANHYNNSWVNIWSNFGSGNIDGHTVSTSDLFYTGDFDGGGDEELLCVQNTNGNADWISMLKYDPVNSKWIWIWSNSGNPSLGNGIYAYRKNLIVGDYDGDGKDELLGNDLTGWTTLFKYNNNNWQWSWTDNGNPSHVIRPYKSKIYAGDFNGDGIDEILGCDFSFGGWTTILQWNGSDFVWGYWSDFGNLSDPIRNYRSNLVLGDYNSDSNTDLVGFSNSASQSATYFTLISNNWTALWNTGGTNSFSGWSYPLSIGDVVLSGNIDNDSRDELLFLQNSPSAAWATTMDYYCKKGHGCKFFWNWSGNPNSPNIPFIDDWPITPPIGTTDTKYLLIKSNANEPKHLLAMRNQGCGYLANMYKVNNPNGNYKTNTTITKNIKPSLNNENHFKVYPNPANEFINIQLPDSSLDHKIIVTDLNGKTLFEMDYSNQHSVRFDCKFLVNGLYLLKIQNKNQTETHKIIITK